MRSVLICAATFMVATSVHAAGLADLTGRWTQTSSQTELVLKPKIKLTPSYSPSMGTSLGGTVGYGSPTTTVVVTEPTPMKVVRQMNLTVQPNGQFVWVIERQWSDGDCKRKVRQEKRGTVTLKADVLTFATTGGLDVSQDSCGKETRGQIQPLREDYRVTHTPGGLKMTGPSADWTFKKG